MLPAISRILPDLRQAVRVSARGRGVTLLAVLALALGIGANTAIFSVASAVLLHPLPYRDPQRLATVLMPDSNPVAPADFLDVRNQAQTFESAGAAEAWSGSLTGVDPPTQVTGLRVTEDVFHLLGIAPLIGRAFDAADFVPGAAHVLVIDPSLWQRNFGGSPDAIGRNILVDGTPYTVVGVMPPGFYFAPFWVQAEMWAPLDLSAKVHNRTAQSLRVFARLKPGVEHARAQTEVDQICRRLAADYPDTDAGIRLQVEPLEEKAVGQVRPALQVLLGAVGLVLLIACANVANLTLARATARHKEIAVRLSLGARRSDVVRQFLTESLVLALSGGAVGLLLASGAIRVLRAMVQADVGSPAGRLPQWDRIALDAPVLFFTLGIALLTGVLFGLAPAIAASRGDVNGALKEGGRGSTAGSGGLMRRGLVAAEIAISLVLLIGAGLLMRSFLHLRAVDPGFDPHNVLTMTISVAGRPNYVGLGRDALYRTVIDRVQSVPGVVRASMTNHLPIAGDTWSTHYAIEGRPIAAPGQEERSIYRVAYPDYFATMNVPLIRGRDFSIRDGLDAPQVAIVNEALARRDFPSEDPIGKRITLGDARGNPSWRVIVGVIHDIKQSSWTDPSRPEIFLPFLQSGEIVTSRVPQSGYMTLVVRTAGNAASLTSAVKAAVWSVDRSLPVSRVETLEEAIGDALWQSRSALLLVGLFSALALLLAMIGIYGVVAYEITLRTHEIGIRMALGAERSGIAKLIATRGLPTAITGVVAGLIVAAGLARLLRSLLYQIDAIDPVTFFVVAALVLAVAAGAAFVPARRATRIDPVIALRQD